MTDAHDHSWIGWMTFDLLLGDVHSLKVKRAIVRPLVADLRRTFTVSAAETGHLDLHRRAGVAVSLVAADSRHVVDVLDGVEDFVARRPEVELLSTRRGLATSSRRPPDSQENPGRTHVTPVATGVT